MGAPSGDCHGFWRDGSIKKVDARQITDQPKAASGEVLQTGMRAGRVTVIFAADLLRGGVNLKNLTVYDVFHAAV